MPADDGHLDGTSSAGHDRNRAVMSASKAFSRRGLGGAVRVRTRQFEVSLTSLDRLYWPDEGITKADLLRYYWQIAKHILPHLKDRPLILKRYPRGIDEPAFFQHDVASAPSYVRTAPIVAENDRKIDYAVCDNRATLLYLINQGVITQNPWHSRTAALDRPDWLVFDLDPGEAAGWAAVCETALALKDVLDRLGLEAYPKTSGSRGIHVYVPIRAGYAYEQSAAVAEQTARLVASENPALATVQRSLDSRAPSQVYVDHLQNARGKTLASAYSVRARRGATASAPLSWREVKRCVEPADFNLQSMHRRLARLGDLFAPVLTKKQNLDRPVRRLEAMAH
jgi:bifunctional non-homologous end joining protein LigD